MNHTNYQQIFTLVALLAGSLSALGCEGDGPEFGSGESTRIVEGVLEPDEDSDSDFFALTNAGTVNILASSIVGTNPETGDPIVAPLLGVSVGQPDPANATLCQLTFSQFLSEGDSFSVYFRDGLFCISVFRNPGSLEGAVYDYVVTMTGAFS